MNLSKLYCWKKWYGFIIICQHVKYKDKLPVCDSFKMKYTIIMIIIDNDNDNGTDKKNKIIIKGVL